VDTGQRVWLCPCRLRGCGLVNIIEQKGENKSHKLFIMAQD